MTDLLFHHDSYIREFEAKVTGVTEDGVILDRTGFYIGGGGQPHDTGALISEGQASQVIKVGRSEGQIVHTIESPPPSLGAVVTGRIDWERRFTL
ncbi:uncharacterized protein METZ01_LOCUS282185, partial [marine metagenome]